ncbi:MAG: type II toxin-antitoxin system PemK/MazF family toxin [Acidobacteriota bacterium]
MREGNVAIAALPQVDGEKKNRPILLLREMPRHQDFLVCGISSRLLRRIPGFDELIVPADADFRSSGLLSPSLFRLDFLNVLHRTKIIGSIGSVSTERHRRILSALSSYLLGDLSIP